MPTTILASRYNNLRNNVNLVLTSSSVASPSYGYGQSFSTNSKVGTRTVTDPINADKVTAQDYEDLYIDIVRCRAHQIGASNVSVDPFVIGDYETNTATADKIEEAYIVGLESLATNIITDRFNVAATNLDLATVPSVNSTRLPTNTWSTVITHIFKMTFPTVQARRHYFNAGGEIRFSASVDYTGSQAKTVDWQTILNAMGSTSFNAENTVNNSGVGTGSNIGNYDLTSSYQLVYSRTGGSVYARNRYNIYAAESATGDATSAITFKVEFLDGAPNDLTWGIDEVVFGTFNSTVQTATPNSQVTINGTVHDAVVINTIPTGTLIRPLS
jgi:hypothetical protein